MSLEKTVFCPAPFSASYVDVKQVAYPCCKVQVTEFENDSQCDLTQNDLSSAYQSKSWSNLRDLFKNNIKPAECSECWSAEQAGCESERMHLIDLFSVTDNKQALSVDNQSIKKLQMVPSVTCNFKCRICDSNYSSAIALEDIQHADDKTKQQLTLDLKSRTLIDIDYYKRILEKSLPDLSMIQVLGGEPVLMKNLPELLEHIIDQGHHRHIDLAVNTNAGSWSDSLVDIITKFKSCWVLISIDAVGQKFEDQRGGSWAEVEQNFDRWLTVPNITIIITATVSIQNVLYVDEIVDFAERKGVYIGWNYVDEPTELCIDNMTDNAKQLVYNKLKDHNHSEIRNIVKRVMKGTSTDGKEFIDLMDLHDLRRNANFRSSHAEIYQAMLPK